MLSTGRLLLSLEIRLCIPPSDDGDDMHIQGSYLDAERMPKEEHFSPKRYARNRPVAGHGHDDGKCTQCPFYHHEH